MMIKKIKFSPELIEPIKKGEKSSTWRLFDDKNLFTGDKVEFYNSENDQLFGFGEIKSVSIKKISEISDEDQEYHGAKKTHEQILTDFIRFYGDKVQLDSLVKIIIFNFISK